jgi:hypothetical protein
MFWIPLLIAIAMMVVAYLIMPKPKAPQPAATRDLETPTADAGRPVPVVFGTLRVKGLNVVWYGELSQKTEKVKSK